MKGKKHFFILALTSLMIPQAIQAEGTPLSHHEDISNGLIAFSENLLVTVPEAATQQNVWADTYIGKLIPSLIPHAGAGISIGGTLMDMSGLKSASEALTEDYNTLTTEIGRELAANSGTYVNFPDLNFGIIPEKFVLPTASVDLRLGGVLLPYDLGLCAIVTNPSFEDFNLQDPLGSMLNLSKPWTFDFMGMNTSVNYLTLGADLRLRIIPESTYIPGLSVGGGYFYTRGYFAFNASNESILSGEGDSEVKQTTEAGLEISYETQLAFLQVQLCKTISGTTIFLGGRGVVSNTTSSWSWNFKTENSSDSSQNISDGDSGTVSTINGIETTVENAKNGDFGTILSNIQPQLYAGLGFNFTVLQITASVCADVRSIFDKENYSDFIWSGALSARVKL